MREYILLAVNIAFTIGLLFYAYNPNEEYAVVKTEMECLSAGLNIAQTKPLCAQCLTRSSFVDSNNGYLVNSTSQYAILKFPYKQESISCKEALHFVDYTQGKQRSVVIQMQDIVGELLSALDVEVVSSKNGKQLIQPRFESFIVLSYSISSSKQGAPILLPNINTTKTISSLFFKLLNIIILIIILENVMNRNEIQKSEKKVSNLLIIAFVLALQLLTSPYAQGFAHLILAITRLLSLIIPVIRVEIRATYATIYFVLGLLMVWNQLTLAVYAYFGLLLILIGGWDKIHVQPLWRYLIVSQLIISINYLVWDIVFQYEADFALRIIQLSQLLVNLLAFTLIHNRKVQRFRQYIPTSDDRPISLSGYDEEEQMVQRS